MKNWLRHIEQFHRHPITTWSDGDVVFEEGDAANKAFVLLDGVVEIRHKLENGRSTVVKLLSGPCFFGVIEFFASENVYLETAQVLGSARTVAFEGKGFLDLVAEEPRLAFEALIDTSRAFCAAAKGETGGLLALDSMLARLLLAYCELFGEPCTEGIKINLKCTQESLAQSVGASERQVQRLFRAWQASEVVNKIGGKYIVCKKALQSFSVLPVTSLVHHGG